MSRVEGVKNYRQYDSRWGSLAYPRKPYYMSGSGCGPTACADIIATNPKHKNITPKDTRAFMIKHGYAVAGHGTAWAGIPACLKNYGFVVQGQTNMRNFFAEMAKGKRCAMMLFGKGSRGGVTWTTGGHFLACSGMKIANGKHYLYMHDPWKRHHDGWYCYETTMKGLIRAMWTCYLPATAKKPEPAKKKDAKKTTETKKTYSGAFPTLPSRGYLKKGDRGEQVKRLQKLLVWAGYSVGKTGADGVYGASTEAAVKSFQKANKITVDGKFGKKSLAKAKTIKK